MFLQLLKYRLKTFLRPSQDLFWAVAFPFILGTFFYLAFGHAMSQSESFNPIKVAMVEESKPDEYFSSFIDSISKEDENQIISVTKLSKDDADEGLKKDDYAGIITVNDEISLTVSSEGYEQSILMTMLNQYKQTSETIASLQKKNPQAIPGAISSLEKSIQSNDETTLSKHKNMDPMTSYFFSLVAMACLYSCFFGFRATINSQANLSALAARRSASPAHKLNVIFSDFLACLIIEYISICLLICYLNFVLHVDFGDQLPFVFLTAFVGCIVGISMGIFITSILKCGKNLKLSILSSASLILCFFSGLMFNGMQNIIEKHFPLFNRINPANLISDSLYSLSIYDDYKRYTMNMLLLTAIAIILCFASFFATRREKYASI